MQCVWADVMSSRNTNHHTIHTGSYLTPQTVRNSTFHYSTMNSMLTEKVEWLVIYEDIAQLEQQLDFLPFKLTCFFGRGMTYSSNIKILETIQVT